MHDTYTSPLASRNASPEMIRLWSPRHKFQTWRRIWLAVAESLAETGIEITGGQLAELRGVVERGITDEEIDRATEIERDLRHDVMAHVHALGEQCPTAKPIIHLGCTSQDVVCNADLLCIEASVELVRTKVHLVAVAMGDAALEHRDLPTLGFTHYQPAQPTTVGRRLANWAHDLLEGARYLEPPAAVRGVRGATGTQASFLKLLETPERVDAFEQRFLDRLFPGREAFGLTGQTYPRVVDAHVLSSLATIASALHKIATDLRLLSNRKEIDEPFGSSQIGSSAMPYKRNPMRCERVCGLSRFVMETAGNAWVTASTQWLERTLDDSSNRRLSLPESFLALDGCLDLMHNVASGLIVHEAMVTRNLMAELPFLASENILMEAVRAGGDRQDLHERIRVHAQEAGLRVKRDGLDNDLIERLRADEAFAGVSLDDLLEPSLYVGRAPEQVDRFVRERIEPLRASIAGISGREPRV